MIGFKELEHFEIWPVKKGIAQIRQRGQTIGWVKQYGFESYGLILKGIRFKNGQTRFAPGAKGKHFAALDELYGYLESPECLSIIEAAALRRFLVNMPAIAKEQEDCSLS